MNQNNLSKILLEDGMVEIINSILEKNGVVENEEDSERKLLGDDVRPLNFETILDISIRKIKNENIDYIKLICDEFDIPRKKAEAVNNDIEKNLLPFINKQSGNDKATNDNRDKVIKRKISKENVNIDSKIIDKSDIYREPIE